MLTLWGAKRQRFCDGHSRRDFLTVGSLGLAGLTLADLLRLQACGAGNGRSSPKAIISVGLPGAPTMDEVKKRPLFGSVVSRVEGQVNGMPPYFALNGEGEASSAYLGPAHNPVVPNASTIDSLRPKIPLERLAERRALLNSFDH